MINKNFILSILFRILALILSFINIKQLLYLLDLNTYAIYVVLFSLMSWVGLLNFKFPISLQNKLSEFSNDREQQRKYLVVTIYLVLLMLLVSLFLVYILSYVVVEYVLPKNNLQDILIITFLFIYILNIIGLTEFLHKILLANHMSFISQFYTFLVPFISFIILQLFINFEIKDYRLIFIGSILSNLVIFISMFSKYLDFKNIYFDKKIFFDMFNIAKKFFIFGLFATMVLRSDYIIMSIILSSKEIVLYSLALKLFMSIEIIYNVWLSIVWPKLSENYYQNRLNDNFILVKQSLLLGLVIVGVISGVIFVFNEYIISFLSNKKIFELPLSVIQMFIIYYFIRIFVDIYATVLQASNHIGIFMFLVPIQGILTISLEYILGKQFGIYGILYSIIIGYLLTMVFILPYYVHRRYKLL